MSDQKAINDKISTKMVKEYLTEHPDFIQKNPELLSLLMPPVIEGAENVVDFQAFMLKNLQQQMLILKDDQGSIIDASRKNLSTQNRIHQAILALLEADGLEHLLHIVKQDWADNLLVDCVSICFDNKEGYSFLKSENIRVIYDNSVKDYFGDAVFSILRGAANVSEEIFGPATPLIQSEALIRIPASEFSPEGILAFGSRDPDHFYPGQGTELLTFMVDGFRGCLIQHLKRQPYNQK
jgi:uncharacterized protein YigA (DUF484 family)